ncbi:MAG: hypothetical protein K0S37_3577, partial [Microbacterium sp.]|nr:hypothetical protein [Microbacterium sp.]
MTSDSRAILYELQDAVVEAQSAEGDRGVAILAEAFDRLRGMLAREDRGWVRLYGDDEDQLFGLTLEDLKNWGRKIGEAVPGAPLVGAGFRRRRDFIWQGGIRYGNLPDGGSQGVRKLKTITQTDTNKLHFYGKSARHRREHRLFTSGIALWKGNDHTKELEAIPLRQITGQFLDPEGLGLVWAYLREWSMVDVRSGRRREYKRWYFTDRFKSKRVLNIATPDGVKIPVDQDHVIFDQHANSTDGLVYGSPDGLAGFIWAGIARDAYMDGISMTEALARFALKATASSKKGAENAAMQYANGNTAGGMAIVGGA